jgi:hypothetical protein
MVKWRNSKEKENLRDDIINGVVTAEMRPSAVYNMRNGTYHKFPYVNFQTNLRNLRIAIAKLKVAKMEDEIALDDTARRWQERPAHGPGNYPIWHESVAKALLIGDIASGAIEGLQPAQVRQRRPEYQIYPLKVFRDFLHKEKTKPVIKAYWEHHRQLKKEKKAK